MLCEKGANAPRTHIELSAYNLVSNTRSKPTAFQAVSFQYPVFLGCQLETRDQQYRLQLEADNDCSSKMPNA